MSVHLFMDVYGHCDPNLHMLKTFLDTTALTPNELLHDLHRESHTIYVAWYNAAIVYSDSKGKTLKQRCRAERLLRLAWREFLHSRERAKPLVPDLTHL
tara:strand:- start:2302 stop:2598 length:297 start_codon:yes stop_codon:yes gene_type:complete